MKTFKFLFLLIAWFLVIQILLFSCNFSSNQPQNPNSEFEIAPSAYAALTEKSLDYLFNFQLESFGEMLSDSIEYELPNGKILKGKTNIIAYWQDYKNTNKVEAMVVKNANYLPIDFRVKPKGDEKIGVKVLVNFTTEMKKMDSQIVLKMNFNFHFDEKKMIDQIKTFYDFSQLSKI